MAITNAFRILVGMIGSVALGASMVMGLFYAVSRAAGEYSGGEKYLAAAMTMVGLAIAGVCFVMVIAG